MVLVVEAAADGLAHRRQRIQPDPCRRTGGDDDLVLVPEGVVLFGQQVRHRVARRDVGQKPERVLEVGQQAHVRIRERRPRAGLQALDGLRRVLAPDDVQPLLHVALVLELRRSRAGRGEELVEVELVELPGARDRQQLVRHLVGQQPHLRQRAVGVPLAGVLRGELFLGALLVGVRPVEDLLFDELARGQRLERRAGEIEVRPRRDGQELASPSPRARSGLRSCSSRPAAYSSLASFLATASSSPSKSSFAVSRHAPKWYSSNTTRSQFTLWSHSFFGLMFPAPSRPSKSWNEPK